MPTLPNFRVVVIVVIILLLVLYPGSQSTTFVEKQTKTSLAKQRHALRILNNSTWSSFNPQDSLWLDLTGFRKHDNYSWTLLPLAKDTAKAQLQYTTGDEGLLIAEGTSNASLVQYQNVTAWVRGRWIRTPLPAGYARTELDLSAIGLDVTYSNLRYERNITGAEGKVQIKLDQSNSLVTEQKNETIQGISAVITIQDETSYGDGWETVMHGYHMPRLGSSVLTTSSEKFGGIYALPHFSLTSNLFELSKPHMNDTLTEAIQKQERELESLSKSSWSSQGTPEDPSNPRCEFIVFLQQFPVHYPLPRGGLARALDEYSSLNLLEKELRYPSGGLFPSAPELQLSMTLFSPDCGFIVESKGPPKQAAQGGRHLQGHKIEIYITQAKQAITVLIVLLLLQLILLVRQMRDASTPAARSRLSFHSIAILSLGSAFIWVAFMVVATVDDAMFLTMMAVAFFAFLGGSFFGMKFLLDIWNAQEPEQNEWQQRQERNDRSSETTPPASDSLPAQAPGEAARNRPVESEGTLPLPVTASRPFLTGPSPFLEPIGQPTPPTETERLPRTTRPSFGAQYTRFYFVLVTLFFVSIHASSSWPPRLRTIYTNLLVLCYLSFWVPQIHRNIIRNCRKALSWSFVLGQSILSIIPFAYFWGFDDNVLFVETDRRVLIVFATWLWLQILALAGQEIVGPRFLVNEKWKWVPPAWDYHPVLREDEEGAAMPVGLTSASTTQDEPGPSSMVTAKPAAAKDKGKKVFDCAICMQDIEVPVVPSGRDPANEGLTSSLSAGFLARRAYMVTPCRHIFHTSCLEAWIGYRLQCPNCRESLPPL